MARKLSTRATKYSSRCERSVLAFARGFGDGRLPKATTDLVEAVDVTNGT